MSFDIGQIQEKLPSWVPFAHPPTYQYVSSPAQLVDFSKVSLWVSVGSIFFNPIFWNFVARNEYRNKSLTKIFGSPYLGCYALAITIFSLGIIRDGLYERALRDQPHYEPLSHPAIQAAGWGLVAAGQILVVTSIYALGITGTARLLIIPWTSLTSLIGTYLGDYFGILMSARVTGFPFNLFSDPMYVGSTFAFLGGALLYRSPVGIALSALVWIVYSSAIQLEGPFTDRIYAGAAKKTDSAPASNPPSAKTTPRKSARLSQASDSSLHGSYAAAAAQPPSEDAVTVTTPKKEPRMAQIRRSARKSRGGSGSEDDGATASGSASPARMTRSRSKGRTLGSDAE